MTRLCRCLAVLFVTAQAGALPANDEPSELARGINLVRDGDLEEAVLTLDRAIRQLSAGSGPAGELARAYLYQGVAYAGLRQEGLAKTKFRLAIQQQPDLRVSADDFPAKVVRLFEQAREAEQSRRTTEAEAKKKRGKGGLLLLGLGGAGAVGIAVAVGARERANSPPVAAIAVTPEGNAIIHVTSMAFSAEASDPDGDSLTFSWDFGDGSSGTGSSVRHVFESARDFRVVVQVGDGLAQTTATTTVTVRDINGSWRPTGPALLGMTELQFFGGWGNQGPGTTGIRFLFAGGVSQGSATITDPREIVLETSCGNTSAPGCADKSSPLVACAVALRGQFDAAIQLLRGTLSARNHGATCPVAGRSEAITLARQ